MQEFQITLKNEKVKLYNQLSWLIIIINALLFAYIGFFASDKNNSISSIIVLAFFAFGFFLKYYYRNTRFSIGLSPFFILFIGAWLGRENYLMAFIVFILDMLLLLSVRKLVVFVNTKLVTYPSSPPKKLMWSDLSNIILKDGMLTIDLKNNNIIQQLIDESKTSVNEQEFNDFCRAQLNQ